MFNILQELDGRRDGLAADGKTNIFAVFICFMFQSLLHCAHPYGLKLESRLSGYGYFDPEQTKQIFLTTPLQGIKFSCIYEVGVGTSPGKHGLTFIRH